MYIHHFPYTPRRIRNTPLVSSRYRCSRSSVVFSFEIYFKECDNHCFFPFIFYESLISLSARIFLSLCFRRSFSFFFIIATAIFFLLIDDLACGRCSFSSSSLLSLCTQWIIIVNTGHNTDVFNPLSQEQCPTDKRIIPITRISCLIKVGISNSCYSFSRRYIPPVLLWIFSFGTVAA